MTSQNEKQTASGEKTLTRINFDVIPQFQCKMTLGSGAKIADVKVKSYRYYENNRLFGGKVEHKINIID